MNFGLPSHSSPSPKDHEQRESKKRPAHNPAEPQNKMMKAARNSNYQCGGQALPEDDIRVSLIELERLLFAMDRQYQQGFQETWHSLQFKLDRCFALWHHIEASLEADTGIPVLPNISPERIEGLRSRVVDLSSKFTAAIAARKEGDSSDELIRQVFRGRPLHKAASLDLERGPAGDESNSEDSSEIVLIDPLEPKEVKPPTNYHRPETTKGTVTQPSIEELQKMQREQVESAISQMASQLKDETARINETLRGQTVGLDELEDVAADNVQKVTDVAKDVQDHVQSNWNRNIGTWTMLFTIVAAFFFCIIIIQMAPKGKGCVFFCERQPHPHEFCRTLPGGRKECIRIDDEDKVDAKIPLVKKGTVSEAGKSEASPDRKDCRLNEYGECIEENEETETEKSFGSDERARQEKHKIVTEVIEETFLGSEASASVVEGKRPIYQGKHFSPRDIRNAANMGDYDLMEAYLTIKPEWVDKADKNGWTVLHLSARKGDVRAVEFLRKIGADFTLQTESGRTANDIALTYFDEGHPIVLAVEL